MVKYGMFQSGASAFVAYKNGASWIRKAIGDFDASVDGEQANKRLDHVGKLTLSAQKDFIQGWDHKKNQK